MASFTHLAAGAISSEGIARRCPSSFSRPEPRGISSRYHPYTRGMPTLFHGQQATHCGGGDRNRRRTRNAKERRPKCPGHGHQARVHVGRHGRRRSGGYRGAADRQGATRCGSGGTGPPTGGRRGDVSGWWRPGPEVSPGRPEAVRAHSGGTGHAAWEPQRRRRHRPARALALERRSCGVRCSAAQPWAVTPWSLPLRRGRNAVRKRACIGRRRAPVPAVRRQSRYSKTTTTFCTPSVVRAISTASFASWRFTRPRR